MNPRDEAPATLRSNQCPQVAPNTKPNVYSLDMYRVRRTQLPKSQAIAASRWQFVPSE